MARTINDYMTAEVDGDFVVFLTGMRLNRWWKVWKWAPLMVAMPRMCRELHRNPDLGMLHYRYHLGLRSMMVIQYWTSFEKLHAWATDRSRSHLPAWRWMNKAVGLNGDIGTWHETYRVHKAECESLYVNMPVYGLGKAMRVTPARGPLRTARGRLGQKNSDWSDLEVPAAKGAREGDDPALKVAAE